jgi:histidyl-tRNA synthetase
MQGTSPKADREKTVAVVPITEDLTAEALKIARTLRQKGIVVEVEVMGRKMSKALEDADRRKMNYAIIVGERELKEGAVVIRDLAKRQQRTVKIERIADELRG